MECAPKVRFAIDSALEGTGFEPSVPRDSRQRRVVGKAEWTAGAANPTLCRHLAEFRGRRDATALRGDLLRPRRDGKPHQGMKLDLFAKVKRPWTRYWRKTASNLWFRISGKRFSGDLRKEL